MTTSLLDSSAAVRACVFTLTEEPFAIDVSVALRDKPDTPVEGLTIKIDAAMPEHSHGMNVAPKLESSADGSYTARGLLFHMPGRWELYFDITRAGVTERAQVSIDLE